MGSGPGSGASSAADTTRINRKIRAREVRVIGSNGDQLGIMPVEEAVRLAEEEALDLVEVAPNSRPPVCRIMDYGKFKYQQKKRQQEAKKNQTQIVIKEVKFRPKTEEHDYQFKLAHIRRFLEEGNRAKITMRFRGREIAHAQLAMKSLVRLAEDVKEVGVVESAAKLEGRNMIMVLAPRKDVKVAAKEPPARRKPEPGSADSAPAPAEAVETVE
jgi:translation initiation factor IF-3